MSRIAIPSPESAPSASQPLLDAVRSQLGVVPNLFRIVAVSPAALEGFLGLFGGLGKGVLDPLIRRRIALAVSEYNGCAYCVSAHTYLAQNVERLDEIEIAASRAGRSEDPMLDAAVRFAVGVTEKRGHVSTAEFDAVRAAGFSDAEIVEIILHVALNTLTNYVNEALLTDVDFPVVQTHKAA